MFETRRRDERGSVLALVVLAMGVLAVLSIAGYESARLGLMAARAQSAATVALFAADEGLESWLAGVGAGTGPMTLDVPPGRASVETSVLVVLDDGTRIVHVLSRGEAVPDAPGAPGRAIALVARIDPAGGRRPVPGTWREAF